MLLIVIEENKYIDDLLSNFEYKKESENDINIYNCKYKEHVFLISTISYGKVNVISTLEYLKFKYKINVIIYASTCQSIDNNIKLLSANVYNGTIQYDVDFSPLGFSYGILPNMKTGTYLTNEDLRNCMIEVCNIYNVDCITDLIASADKFVNNNNLSRSIKTYYNVSTIDINSGSIGQFSYKNKIPYAGISIVSSYANYNAIKTHNLYEDEAIKLYNKIIYKFIKLYYE